MLMHMRGRSCLFVPVSYDRSLGQESSTCCVRRSRQMAPHKVYVCMSKEKSRETNFEVLRSLIMFFIVVWHSLVHGMNFVKMMNITKTMPVDLNSFISVFNYLSTGVLMTVTSVAVNCYVLITGYFMINCGFKWNKILHIWVQTAFYSFLIALIVKVTGLESFGYGGLLFSAFPVWNGEYWFVTKYLGLVALAPFLAKMPQVLSRKEYETGLLVMFILNIYLSPYFSYGDIYGGGSSLLWFIFLFFVGGYIRLYNPFTRYKGQFGKWFLLCCLLFSAVYVVKDFLLYYIKGQVPDLGLGPFRNNSYEFFTAVLLFLWAKYHTFSSSSIVRFLVKIAPFTFGVYLIHDNNHVRNWLWETLDLTQFSGSCWLLFILLGISIAVFLICILLDYGRSRLFQLFHVKDILNGFF